MALSIPSFLSATLFVFPAGAASTLSQTDAAAMMVRIQACRQEINENCRPLHGHSAIMRCAWTKIESFSPRCQLLVNGVFDLDLASSKVIVEDCQNFSLATCPNRGSFPYSSCASELPPNRPECRKGQNQLRGLFETWNKRFVREFGYTIQNFYYLISDPPKASSEKTTVAK